jgi:REP element-mobilizing transposase RayT
MQTDVLAYFLTFTIYGTYLQGDARWWCSRREGRRSAQPRLEAWHRARLRYPVLLLNAAQRIVVAREIERLSAFRHWHLWQCNARSNHVHVLVSGHGMPATKMRNQFKANCTRALRERWHGFNGRPVWSSGGHWGPVKTEKELEQVLFYVGEGQDRKGREVAESETRAKRRT